MNTKKAPAKSKAPAGKKAASKKAGKKSAEETVVEEIPSETASTEIPVEDEQQAGTGKPKTGKRNNDKYKLDGQLYGKGRLTQAIVRKYVSEHQKVTYKQLKEVMPDTLIPRFGIFQDENGCNNLASAGRSRYFMGESDGIKLADKKTIYVCSQLTSKLIEPIIANARKLGMKITVASE